MPSLDLDRPDGVIFAGVLLTVVSTFLPWRRPGGALPDATATAGYEGLGFLAVVAALAVFATAAVMRHDRTSALVAVGGGLGVLALALVEFLRLGGPMRPGVGLFLALVAGVVVSAGGLLGVRAYA
ncbi:hypothetical protein EGH21_12820 [Halomicroarcula sp. F13]|uniref:Uncharacterized protein n=1 Tax=Haloarcula rubra TaxID=2487747 RepID=A0AAW4PSE9_9EURY|nr:hypothetical protein [Halomicroarcula rubra]MBX0323913.1 hypothetical protein [Halomicroarcula rubra]